MRRRHKNHAVTAMTRPRPGHDGHGHRHGHDGHGTTATGTTAMHDGRRRDTATIMHSHITRNHGIQRNAPARYHTTQHVNRTNIRANRRSIEHVYQCCAYNKPPGRGVSPRSKSRGRWLSSADAECSLEHFWITRYLRSLHIFSGCNRFCTLHIVYNVPWIDVDGGRAQLGSASISGCYHSLRVA